MKRPIALVVSLSLIATSVAPAFAGNENVAGAARTAVPATMAAPRLAPNTSLQLGLKTGVLETFSPPGAAVPQIGVSAIEQKLATDPVQTDIVGISPVATTETAAVSAETTKTASLDVTQRADGAEGEKSALPALNDAAKIGEDATIFWDEAKKAAPTAPETGVKALSSAPRPNELAATSSAEKKAVAAPPAPRAKLWQKLASLALPAAVVGFFWLTDPGSTPAPQPEGTDWDAISKGIAVGAPLVSIGLWGMIRSLVYRKKEAPQVGPANLHAPVMSQFRHYLSNFAFGAIGIGVLLTANPHITAAFQYINDHGIGLLHWLGVKGWANVAASVVVLDFLNWAWHLASHKSQWLWRLHKVHHSDVDFDYSTTYRNHWLEMLAEFAARMLEYALVGPTLFAMAVYEFINLVQGQWTHGNIRLPERLEKLLSPFLVTSRSHFIHHSMGVDDYDRNFGFLFSFWDRLFGMHREHAPESLGKIKTGIDEYPKAPDVNFWNLMWMPFAPQEPWTKKAKE